MPRQKLLRLLGLRHDLIGGRLLDVARRRRDPGRHLNDASTLLRLLSLDDGGDGDVVVDIFGDVVVDIFVDDGELFRVLSVVMLGLVEAVRLGHDGDLETDSPRQRRVNVVLLNRLKQIKLT